MIEDLGKNEKDRRIYINGIQNKASCHEQKAEDVVCMSQDTSPTRTRRERKTDSEHFQPNESSTKTL